MANFQSLEKKARTIKPKQVRKALFDYIKKVEKVFIDANISQIENHEDSKGNELKNSDSRYTGVYSEATEAYAELENPRAEKKAGEPYNFLWSGDFLSNFETYVSTGSVEINSTGTGANDKAKFFDGYKDLFGITPENLAQINDSKLIPFLQIYYKRNLGL
jgi:hypothetical protein